MLPMKIREGETFAKKFSGWGQFLVTLPPLKPASVSCYL